MTPKEEIFPAPTTSHRKSVFPKYLYFRNIFSMSRRIQCKHKLLFQIPAALDFHSSFFDGTKIHGETRQLIKLSLKVQYVTKCYFHC